MVQWFEHVTFGELVEGDPFDYIPYQEGTMQVHVRYSFCLH